MTAGAIRVGEAAAILTASTRTPAVVPVTITAAVPETSTANCAAAAVVPVLAGPGAATMKGGIRTKEGGGVSQLRHW